jgi:hypothetical protein
MKLFGSKREEVTGGWRRLHIEELHNWYISKDIIRLIKSRRMKWVGHVTCRIAYKVLIGKPEGKRLLGRLGIDGRIILK